MPDIKPQVYKDDRPAEYFDQFHAAARRGVGWTYTFVRIVVSLPTLLIYRVRAIGVKNVPKTRAAGPRPQPLQPDGPLLRRPLPAAEDPLHGEIADVRPAGPHLHLQARRRLPGAPRPARRGGLQDRLRADRPGRDAARLRRGRALAQQRAGRAETGDRPDRAGVGRADRPGRDPRLGQGAPLEALPLPQGHRRVRRADDLRGGARAEPRAPDGGRRPRSSPRCGEMYEGLATRSERRASRRSSDRAPA